MGIDAFGRSTADSTTSARPSGVPGTPGPGVFVPGWALALLLAVIGLGGSAFFLVRAERENRDDPLQQAVRGEIFNLGPGSLLRADRLPAAFAAGAARLKDDEVVTGLTISPSGLSMTVRDPGAFQRIVDVDVALGTSVNGDAGRSEADGLAPAKVQLAGVQPALRKVLARIEERTARIDAVRLSLRTEDGVARQFEWQITVDEVRPRDTSWYARADGRAVRRSDEDAVLTQPELAPTPTPEPPTRPVFPTPPSSSSTTTSSSSITVVRNGKRTRLSGKKARSLQRCLEKARGDGLATQACLANAGL